MNKSFSGRSHASGSVTDRSRAKSTDREIKAKSFTREIVIKTQEADIPQITILKVERQTQSQYRKVFQTLENTIQRLKLKRIFQGFCQICIKTQSSRLLSLNINRLVFILKYRQKNLLGYSWQKLSHLKLKYKSKIYTSRLISKLSLLLLKKNENIAFEKIKEYVQSKSIGLNKSAVKEKDENLQIELAKLKSHQFSEKFMALCKKFTNIRNFMNNVETELQPEVLLEIERYLQLRNRRGSQINNEIVLVVLSNQIINAKGLKKEIEANANLIKELQQQNGKEQLALYEKIQADFIKADNEIRNSLEKNKKIQEKSLTRIIQTQMKLWEKASDIPLYQSRLFISAIIIKLIKDDNNILSEFTDNIDLVLHLSADNKKLEEYKKTLKGKEKTTTLTISIINKFIELNNALSFGMTPIIERGYSENEETFMSQITYMKDEIRDFIHKFNNPAEKSRVKKTFETKRTKPPQQLRDLYTALNDLINLIQNRESRIKKETVDKTDIIIKILATFKDCLMQGNYNKWENFINKEVNKDQFRILLNLLDSINDILNEKITVEGINTNAQLEKLRKSQAKMKQENGALKNKNGDLEKKVKSLESSQIKEAETIKLSESAIKDKDREINEWERKYKELNGKYKQLEQASKIKTNKQLTELRRKISIKDEQIAQLKQEINQYAKNQTDLQKLKNQYEVLLKKSKTFETNISNLKQELNLKNKRIQEYEKQRKIDIESSKKIPPPSPSDNNASNSLTLIKELNKQLDKLKKSEIVSEQYNKSTHTIEQTEVIIEKVEFKASVQVQGIISEKNKLIEDLENKIKSLNSEISYLVANTEKLNSLLAEKQHSIKKIEIAFKEKQLLAHKDLESKMDYIIKLEGLIETNQRTTHELNMEILKLKNRPPEVPDYMKNQGKLLEDALNQLKIKESLIQKLQRTIKDHEAQFKYDKQRLENQIRTTNLKINQTDTLLNEVRTKNERISKLQTQINSNEQKYLYQKQRWETEWKNHSIKFDQANAEKAKLMSQITLLNQTLDQLKLKMSNMSFNSSVYLDNIVLLLTNLLFGILQHKPKTNDEANTKVASEIFNDLTAIKIKYAAAQNQMFMQFENYAVKFVQADIGKYRYELTLRIDELKSIKQRFLEFFNKEIQFSKHYLSYKFQYELKDIKQWSTIEKTVAETPMKIEQKELNIVREFQEQNVRHERTY